MARSEVKGTFHHVLCGCPISLDGKCSQSRQYIPLCVLHRQRKLSFSAYGAVAASDAHVDSYYFVGQNIAGGDKNTHSMVVFPLSLSGLDLSVYLWDPEEVLQHTSVQERSKT